VRSAALLLLLATPAFAEGGPKPAQVDAMAAAIARAGCVVSAGNQGTVLKDAGLTEAEGAAVLDVLVRDGKASPAGADAVRLEGCK